MIGLKWNIPNKYDVILKKIFENIDFHNYKWHLSENEILTPTGEDFFSNQVYENDAFQKMITTPHYPIFVTLELWTKTSKITEMKDYPDFLKENCELILFVTDSIYVEIYSKQEKLLEAILNNVKHYNMEKIEIMTTTTQIRNKFSAYFD